MIDTTIATDNPNAPAAAERLHTLAVLEMYRYGYTLAALEDTGAPAAQVSKALAAYNVADDAVREASAALARAATCAAVVEKAAGFETRLRTALRTSRISPVAA